MNVSISLGNSDNKLPQKQWADFVEEVRKAVYDVCCQIHFFGGPPNYESWQNMTIVFDVSDAAIPHLKEDLTKIRTKYFQEAIAWLEGETEFI
jgi:hypothetical protein